MSAQAGSGRRQQPPVSKALGLSPHWQELPPKYGPDAWELRVWDEHWYRVFGTKIVLCPIGIGQGYHSSTDEAKRTAEQMYLNSLRRAIERASRMTLTANAGLAMLKASS